MLVKNENDLENILQKNEWETLKQEYTKIKTKIRYQASFSTTKHFTICSPFL